MATVLGQIGRIFSDDMGSLKGYMENYLFLSLSVTFFHIFTTIPLHYTCIDKRLPLRFTLYFLV